MCIACLSPFFTYFLYVIYIFIFSCVVVDSAATIYAETREEARDYARLRNMCFDQVRTQYILSVVRVIILFTII